MTLTNPETETCNMHCYGYLVNFLCCGLMLAGLWHLVNHRTYQSAYGRHMGHPPCARTVPARVSWFVQEMPALLVPLLLLLTTHKPSSMGKYLLLGTWCLHYFQRTFVYSLLTRGQPVPVDVMMTAGLVCSVVGFLQGHYLLHCAQFDDGWSADYRFKTGLVLFYIGLAINVHSDYILRNLRKPGEVIYKIPKGGMFEYVSAANYLGEIMEWFGYSIATWSFPGFSFAIFSLCFIGTRAYYHHRYYLEKFKDYPKLRKALIPFIF
ncbi:3-oxo-5-alpha-steroid 4-dehydrogenase 2b [Myripristis murdjan]|uniref:3-oxo-5-alpha-steroid 4-dehydrogenase n=1 Tax=Myripristis murdjan TaxID=586833 RepID=A0A667ZMU2_9TELE|nr:3-oxo-5-alpha-steroid 4-dehydrogenase 2-like [Myripristis murdjan]XP_029926572.1 3-oxo-5-alpha-steroid 4-dehydrogenase 2-like [Myripristis murdjan]